MASSTPLQGSELIDCARANENQDIEIVASRCGYDDIATFESELRQACQAIGVDINGFDELINHQQSNDERRGVIFAPESPNQL